MSRIRIKTGRINQKVEIVKGIYSTGLNNDRFKIDIEKPIEAILAIWEGAKKASYYQEIENGKKEILKLLEGVEENNSNIAKRMLAKNLRNTYEDGIKDNETKYKEYMEFIRNFRTDREANYVTTKEFCQFVKKQIERIERSIK